MIISSLLRNKFESHEGYVQQLVEENCLSSLNMFNWLIWFLCLAVIVTNIPLVNSRNSCDYSKKVIVISRGRSGSTYLTEVLARNILGTALNEHQFGEILGTHSEQMAAKKDPQEIITRHLCSNDEHNDPYRGFKWKPYIWSDKYIRLLRFVAERKIPVVHNTRNPIDTFLSGLKHRNHTSGKVPAHCLADDKECIAIALGAQRVHVDTHELLGNLNYTIVETLITQKLLNKLGVHHLNITYEEMIDPARKMDLWHRVFKFFEPRKRWVITDLMVASQWIPTSSSLLKDKIENYEEVKSALKDTPFELFLH